MYCLLFQHFMLWGFVCCGSVLAGVATLINRLSDRFED